MMSSSSVCKTAMNLSFVDRRRNRFSYDFTWHGLNLSSTATGKGGYLQIKRTVISLRDCPKDDDWATFCFAVS